MPTAETLTVLQVAVPTPVYGTFDYLPPHGIDARDLQAGVRLRVPFGRTQATGIVMAINKASRIDPRRLRPAIAALDPAPVIGQDLLALGQWAAHYYHHPIGEVFATLLPALLPHGRPRSCAGCRPHRAPTPINLPRSTTARAPHCEPCSIKVGWKNARYPRRSAPSPRRPMPSRSMLRSATQSSGSARGSPATRPSCWCRRSGSRRN